MHKADRQIHANKLMDVVASIQASWAQMPDGPESRELDNISMQIQRAAGALLGVKYETNKPERYFEIISRIMSPPTVVGVCSEDGIDREIMGSTIGEITEEQFDTFGDEYWTVPISSPNKRYIVSEQLTLTKTK